MHILSQPKRSKVNIIKCTNCLGIKGILILSLIWSPVTPLCWGKCKHSMAVMCTQYNTCLPIQSCDLKPPVKNGSFEKSSLMGFPMLQTSCGSCFWPAGSELQSKPHRVFLLSTFAYQCPDTSWGRGCFAACLLVNHHRDSLKHSVLALLSLGP